ncbi:atypical short-chain dehydrogenase/reductase [Malaciobacter halophilus]|uniref:NAD(P)-binding domain-containing protein n=1 Tax=Malaciobacter halophilus TaxID=197482 RepID=UPI000E109FE7|nr:NAD(P)-binding domain-containing protein [Malaciobacter halophilus]AXH10188.1 atypical short-chain dehydrogenase/reductase [Malaciobacter halophilus]
MKTVSILGCGWLGLEVGKTLYKKGFNVQASTTTNKKIQKLKKEGFTSFLIDTKKENNDLRDFLNCDILLICIPSRVDNFLEFLDKIYQDLKKTHIILISSTSIYPNENKDFDEDYHINKTNCGKKNVYEIEEFCKENFSKLTILRCAGLMGYDRFAAKYFHNKVVKDSNKKVNFVHKDDVVCAIEQVIKTSTFDTFNLCSKQHPTKKQLYSFQAKNKNIKILNFENTENYNNRIIIGNKITNKLNFSYKFDNPFTYFLV